MKVTIFLVLASFVESSGQASLQKETAAAPSSCSRFERDLKKAMPATVKRITAQELGGELDGTTIDGQPAYKIGSLYYFGAGVEAVTSDARFRDVRVTAGQGAHHRCGYQVSIFPGPWNMLIGQTASPAFRFEEKRVSVENTVGAAAAEAGVTPVLAGYLPGASWPVRASGKSDTFIGLMHPKSGQRETLVVQFKKAESRESTRLLARLPMLFQSIGILPRLHAPGRIVNLSGKDPEGPYRNIVLQMSDEELR
jgi:hypothetical protein